ncbi:MAG: DegT/DnrJ/EryC1/StrS family aminotransferase [Sedimentisphaerales bacterium]|nr:DegT/DnrJ/EryC1/StrS family aminotransferase [Sedimentisphaerales bacterium]
MNTPNLTRRHFLAAASVGTLAAVSNRTPAYAAAQPAKPAILGGPPVRTRPFSSWPIWDQADEESIISILRSGNWFRGRGKVVDEFETQYARMMDAKACMGTVNGTNALLTALHVLGIGIGDEVLVPPYTFVATVSVVLMSNALPVFVDVDPRTFQMDPAKIEEKITEHTRAILPVHILGTMADMDRINAIGKKHTLKVIEDACQAHLAEWKGKKAGSLGDLGCFSFQNSKNLPSGEGGAIIGNDTALLDKCHSFTNCGRSHGSVKGRGFAFLGTNRRMTQYQAAILMGQMKRIEKDAEIRNANARYLTSRIEKIPGITPQKAYQGQTLGAYHLYAFRYDPEQFGRVSRDKFLSALRAEGIPCSSGYRPLNKEGIIEDTLTSRNFQKAFSAERLENYRRQNNCPVNDKLCTEAVWLPQWMLLGPKADMDDIADAIQKIYDNRQILA